MIVVVVVIVIAIVMATATENSGEYFGICTHIELLQEIKAALFHAYI